MTGGVHIQNRFFVKFVSSSQLLTFFNDWHHIAVQARGDLSTDYQEPKTALMHDRQGRANL